MHPHLTDLLVLQERDLKLQHAHEDLESITPEATKIKSALATRVDALERAKQAFLSAQNDVKQINIDRQTRKDTILKLKTRQGETKRNEEYQMLEHEIDRYGKEIDELETKELELLELVDRKKCLREEAHQDLVTEKEFASQQSQALVAKKQNAETKIKELKMAREQLAQSIDANSLALYDRILSRRGAGAIALISQSGQCSGCNIKLPPATIHRVQAGQELGQCSECSRILYNA